jgi:hypothetical protein
MITDPTPARTYRSAGNTTDPDSLPIDPKEVTQKPLDRERVIDAQPLRRIPPKRDYAFSACGHTSLHPPSGSVDSDAVDLGRGPDRPHRRK